MYWDESVSRSGGQFVIMVVQPLAKENTDRSGCLLVADCCQLLPRLGAGQQTTCAEARFVAFTILCIVDASQDRASEIGVQDISGCRV